MDQQIRQTSSWLPIHAVQARRSVTQRPIYIGQVCHNDVVYPGEQPAIVDRALWQRVQYLKADARRRVPHGKVEALLSGVLYRAQCGERMRSTYSSTQGGRRLYYVCRNKKADPVWTGLDISAITAALMTVGGAGLLQRL